MNPVCFVLQDKVSAIGMFANLDLAEGVLDAVMQVITCTVCHLSKTIINHYVLTSISANADGPCDAISRKIAK